MKHLKCDICGIDCDNAAVGVGKSLPDFMVNLLSLNEICNTCLKKVDDYIGTLIEEADDEGVQSVLQKDANDK